MKKLGLFFIVSALAVSAQAQVVITVTDEIPDGANGSGTRSLTTTDGNVSAPATLPTLTYTVTNLDLTSVGGAASETIVFDIDFSQTGGTGVGFNGFGNIYVTGGNANQISPGDALTASVSLTSTTFDGGNLSNLSIGFTSVNMGGYSNLDVASVTHDGGTIDKDYSTDTNRFANFAVSDAFTLATISSPDGVNLQGFDVEITAIPEPSSLALLGLGLLGLFGLRHRRR
jgi:hypothetical protein